LQKEKNKICFELYKKLLEIFPDAKPSDLIKIIEYMAKELKIILRR